MPLREKQLIQAIRRSANAGRWVAEKSVAGRSVARSSVVKGIGDDCAVLRVPPGHELLVTTDFTLENVHFRRDWHRPEWVGRRCLTRGLSDIAAMGGEPQAAFLSLAIASDVPQKWVDRFMDGLLHLAKEFGVPLAGGDTAQSTGGVQADIIVVGSVPKGKAVLRSGAEHGDSIFVTGQLGGQAAVLAAFAQSKPGGADYRKKIRLAQISLDQISTPPRVAVGQWLRRRGVVSSMIDLSDGLSTDLEHICEESHVGAEIEASMIPRALSGRAKKAATLEQALNGGDDYELLFTSAAKIPPTVAGVQVTRIGQISRSTGMRIIAVDGRPRPLKAAGWEHFTVS